MTAGRTIDTRARGIAWAKADSAADVQFDSDGLMVDYPGIATRIGKSVSQIRERQPE